MRDRLRDVCKRLKRHVEHHLRLDIETGQDRPRTAAGKPRILKTTRHNSCNRFIYGRSWVVWSWVTMDFSDTSSDELEERNAWNPMLELFFHAHFAVYMEVLVDDKELERIALSGQFALHILFDKT